MFNMLLSITETIKGFFVFIPKVLYFIVACLLSLMDLCQIGFRKLAGLDTITISGESYQGDTVYKIITDALFTGKYPAIQTVFWSLIALGIFMLFITSIIAIIRLEYAPDEKTGNSKSRVVKNFFKAIFSFAIVPIACIFGMFLSNALVGVIDQASSSSFYSGIQVEQYFQPHSEIINGNSEADEEDVPIGSITVDKYYMAYQIFGYTIPTSSQPFSGSIFKACAYGCNRIRNSENYYLLMKEKNVLGLFNNIHSQKVAANVIDVGFSINAKLDGKYSLSKTLVEDYFKDSSIPFAGWTYSGIGQLSKYNVSAVLYFYNLWSFNYIIGFIALISIAKMYLNFLLYLMQRVFEVVGLFVISPISISLMPLDNGQALGTWRKTFISKFAVLVVMVLSLNLVSPLIEICQQIVFFENLEILNYILLTFFIMAAFNAVDSLNKMFSSIIGAGDAYAAASEVGNKMTGDLKAGVRKTVAGAKIAAAPAILGAKLGMKGTKATASKISDKLDSKRDVKLENKQNEVQQELSTAEQQRDEAAEFDAAGINGGETVSQKVQRVLSGRAEYNAITDDAEKAAYEENYLKRIYGEREYSRMSTSDTAVSHDSEAKDKLKDYNKTVDSKKAKIKNIEKSRAKPNMLKRAVGGVTSFVSQSADGMINDANDLLSGVPGIETGQDIARANAPRRRH